MFEELLVNLPQQQFSIGIMAINLVLSTLLGFVIATIYKRTHSGISYSQSFVVTIMLLTIITTIAMMVIGGNLVTAFALLGTFTIIRFRTAIKDSRDTAFVFLALVIGLGVGTLHYGVAIVSTLIVCGIIWLLHKYNFGAAEVYDYMLTITLSENSSDTDMFRAVFEDHLKEHTPLRLQHFSDNTAEAVYTVTLKNMKKVNDFAADLRKIDNVKEVELVSRQHSIEY